MHIELCKQLFRCVLWFPCRHSETRRSAWWCIEFHSSRTWLHCFEALLSSCWFWLTFPLLQLSHKLELPLPPLNAIAVPANPYPSLEFSWGLFKMHPAVSRCERGILCMWYLSSSRPLLCLHIEKLIIPLPVNRKKWWLVLIFQFGNVACSHASHQGWHVCMYIILFYCKSK